MFHSRFRIKFKATWFDILRYSRGSRDWTCQLMPNCTRGIFGIKLKATIWHIEICSKIRIRAIYHNPMCIFWPCQCINRRKLRQTWFDIGGIGVGNIDGQLAINANIKWFRIKGNMLHIRWFGNSGFAVLMPYWHGWCFLESKLKKKHDWTIEVLVLATLDSRTCQLIQYWQVVFSRISSRCFGHWSVRKILDCNFSINQYCQGFWIKQNKHVDILRFGRWTHGLGICN